MDGEMHYMLDKFTHIPKTGGISVCHALGGDSKGHVESSGKGFCFIREPIDRYISAYCYLRDGGRTPKDVKRKRKFIEGTNINSFAKRWLMILSKGEPHFRPQSWWIRGGVEYIGKYDKLEEHLKIICKYYGVETKPMKVLNKSRREHAPLSMDTKKLIRTIYKKDYEIYRKAPILPYVL